MKEYNVSAGHDNFTQRNNDIDKINVCGPTNFAQCLGYAGWEPDMGIAPQFNQLDDKITYFTRTNKDVLKYYETHYNGMYNNWMRLYFSTMTFITKCRIIFLPRTTTAYSISR